MAGDGWSRHTAGQTPRETIRARLPMHYDMRLNNEDMLTVLDALNAYGDERAVSLRGAILETLLIEEI